MQSTRDTPTGTLSRQLSADAIPRVRDKRRYSTPEADSLNQLYLQPLSLGGTLVPPYRRALERLSCRDEQVVEQLSGEIRLEHARVDLLQGDVAAEGEAAPAEGDRFGLGAGLDRAQAPAPGVGEQLLAADVAALEAAVAEDAAQVGGGEGVDVD